MRSVALLIVALAMSPVVHAQGVAVYAAGSLREAFMEVAQLWQAGGRAAVTLTFGASGLLRERIEAGEAADVFASADTDHPRRLASTGAWQPPVVFVRNALCALVAPQFDVAPGNLLDTLLRAEVRLGTSTPRADPSGDYAWDLFRKAGAARQGAYEVLAGKALKLTGGPDSPRPPQGRGTYAWVMDSGQADIFLTYCTNAEASRRELPRLRVVRVPPELEVSAAYGLTVRTGATQSARDFAEFVRSAPAQAVFARLGFVPP